MRLVEDLFGFVFKPLTFIARRRKKPDIAQDENIMLFNGNTGFCNTVAHMDSEVLGLGIGIGGVIGPLPSSLPQRD